MQFLLDSGRETKLGAAQFTIEAYVNDRWVSALPFLAEPPSFAIGTILESPQSGALLLGAWWFLGLSLLMGVFNTILGEEFLFRDVLLPKMNSVFSRWDCVANGMLTGAYHWHQPWMIPGGIIAGALVYALPAKRFRSTWMAIIPHSMQIVLFGFLILGIVLGLA